MGQSKEISLIGFGHFTISKVAARTGRNPRTGDALEVAGYNQPKFKVGSKLKAACNKKDFIRYITMQTGTIKWFNSTKGYGFIEPSDKSRDVFVHISAVQHLDINKLDPGTKVSFEIEKQYGKLSATNIKLI